MLSPYRVLDLTDDRGELTGMVLADLGADVIRVEPPQGSPARRRGPRLPDAPEAEQSLQFAAYNRGKRSVVIDLERAEERELFLRLVTGADFVLESAPPSVLDRHGLGFGRLRQANPRIVFVQLTPFGIDGPYADTPASDLSIAALGGPVSLQGIASRAPVRVTVPQVWRHAGAEGATAALVAHALMQKTGEAQRVDVSAQAAMTWTMLGGMNAAAIQGKDFERSGSLLQLGPITLPAIFPCADGFVAMVPMGNQIGRVVRWLIEDGLVDDSWAEEDWDSYQARVMSGRPVSHAPDEMMGAVLRFLTAHGKHELLERGLAQDVTVAPVNTVPDLLDLDHLAARGFWNEVKLASGDVARAPAAFLRSTPPLATRVPSPRLDEHGAEIRAELAARPRSAAAAPSPEGQDALPFAGLKVADLSWVGVGPGTARYLADHGATVVRVESEVRPDAIRIAGPFKDGEGGWNRSQFYGDYNTSKLGLALDLGKPEAVAVARRLIDWADVYLESFTPGTVDRMGVGYETVRATNPSLVMVSTCLMGQDGPAAGLAGFGYHAGAIAGFYEVTGWPGEPPDGPWFAYTDTVAPRFLAAALMAALDHRRRTGLGQHIDAAQLEMALQFLAPEILDYQVSGYAATRLGNRARDAAPQGVYPCASEDQWVAIAVETDSQWQALRRAVGDPQWSRVPELSGLDGRLALHDAIDAGLAAWTRERAPRQVMETLAAAGVPAGAVQRSSDLAVDPQHRHRRFHRELEHPEMGRVPYAGHQFRIHGYDSGPRAPAPVLGQHGVQVMTELLGMSDDEVAEVVASGAMR
jgi:crotonobetainyl-CoA:carnitine CoA-transferase CaiB-like acyl-CoA transferase